MFLGHVTGPHDSLRRLITNDAPKRTYVRGGPTVKESRMMLGISQCHTRIFRRNT